MLVIGIVVAIVAAFIFSSVYYVVATPLERRAIAGQAVDRGKPEPARIVLELLRTAVLVSGFAWIADRASMRSLPESLGLALVLWLVFPVVLLVGSVSWDRVPAATALLHAGDWLFKLLLIGLVLGLLH